MSDRRRADDDHETTSDMPGRRFRRRLRGYDAHHVDIAFTRVELRVVDLEEQAVDLREQLLEAQHVASEARHDLTRARAELRYWNDRASYVDSEVTRARQRATELEQAARLRAESIEADAQERSLQLIDRVCHEANAMLQHAREEAREMFLRFETDVDLSQRRLEKLEDVRREFAQTMQGALHQFEGAVRELDKFTPARRIVEALEQPTRRALPTFGTQKALDAAKRFDAKSDGAAALSTPLPDALTARVEDAATSDEIELQESASTAPVNRRSHNADDEFAALMLQP